MAVIRNQRCHNQLLESVLTQSGESPATIQAHPQATGVPSRHDTITRTDVEFLENRPQVRWPSSTYSRKNAAVDTCIRSWSSSFQMDDN